MWFNISSKAHYRRAGGDYSCQQGQEQTFVGFMGSNFEKGVSHIFLDRVRTVSVPDAAGSIYLGIMSKKLVGLFGF